MNFKKIHQASTRVDLEICSSFGGIIFISSKYIIDSYNYSTVIPLLPENANPME